MYAKRYGISLQDVMYGANYLPDNGTLEWIVELTTWINYYEYVSTVCMELGSCPDHIKDDPNQFNSWKKSKELAKRT